MKALLSEQIGGKSFETIWRCLQLAPSVISSSFVSTNIMDAFRTAGIIPYNARQILNVNNRYDKMTETEIARLESHIDSCTNDVVQYGYVRETTFDQLLSEYPLPEIGRTSTLGHLNDLSISRQRCVIMNHQAWMEKDQQRKQNKRISSRNITRAPIIRKAPVSKKNSNFKCSNKDCLKINGDLVRCRMAWCRTRYCLDSNCVAALENHEILCGFVKK
jgi:hypothetical protein